MLAKSITFLPQFLGAFARPALPCETTHRSGEARRLPHLVHEH